MGMFGNNETVVTTFAAKDLMSPVVKGMRATLDQFKRDARTGFGLAGGISVFNLATQAIGGVVDAMGDSLKAYQQDRLSQTQLRAALEANIRAWDGNADAIEDVIAARMRLGFSDDEQRSSLALLVAQVQDVNDALAIQRTAMDLARLKGTSLTESANLLAKAYNGSATGLQRMGIKVREGARGMDALADVQKRVNGQAEAFANSSVGKFEAMNVKLGELQEAFGELIAGPAADFVGFLTGLIDSFKPHNEAIQAGIDYINRYGQAVEEATSKGEKLASELEAEAVQAYADAWRDYLDVNMDVINQQDMTGNALRMLRDNNLTLARATGQTVDTLTVLALRVQALGGDLDEFVIAQQGLIGQGIDLRKMAMRYVRSFDDIGEAAEDAGDALDPGNPDGPTAAVRQSMNLMFRTMEEAKAPWKRDWRQLAAWAKDPFKPDAFENWVQARIRQALRKAKQAEQDHMPGAARRWRRIAALMKNPIFAALTDIGIGVQEALADVAIVERAAARLSDFTSGLFDVFGNDNDGGGNKRNKRNNGGGGGSPHQPPTGTRAAGGPVEAGGVYRVGERGPEWLVMGNRGGNVIPNHAGGRMAPIIVNVDGRRLFEITDARSGRAIAMGGA